jgi:hypothetical protein
LRALTTFLSSFSKVKHRWSLSDRTCAWMNVILDKTGSQRSAGTLTMRASGISTLQVASPAPKSLTSPVMIRQLLSVTRKSGWQYALGRPSSSSGTLTSASLACSDHLPALMLAVMGAIKSTKDVRLAGV